MTPEEAQEWFNIYASWISTPHGPVGIEDMYQAFKARMLDEIRRSED